MLFTSFLCCGIFLGFKISCSGINKISQMLKCLLCNPDKLCWTSGTHIKGEEENIRHWVAPWPPHVLHCNPISYAFYYLQKITIKNWKNSCSGSIQGKKQWTCQFYSKFLLAWRSYRLQCGGLIGFNVEKRECYSRETSLTVRGCTPSTPVQGLEEWQRDGFKQSSILSASVGI